MKQLLRDTFWMVGRYSVIFAARLGLTVGLATLLATEFFGQYQIAITLLGLLSLVSLPEMNTAITRAVASGYEGAWTQGTRERLRWSLWGCALLALFALLTLHKDRTLGLALLAITPLFPAYAALTTPFAYLFGKQSYYRGALWNVFLEFVRCICVLVVALSTRSLFLTLLAAIGSLALGHLWLCLRVKGELKSRDSGEGVITLGRHLTWMSLAKHLLPYADKLVIGLASYSLLALYALAIAPLLCIQEGLRLISDLLIPRLMQGPLAKRSYLVLCLGGLVALGALYFALPPLFTPLFGEKYPEAARLAQWALLPLVALVPASFLCSRLEAQGAVGVLYRYYIIQGASHIAFFALLFPLFSLRGALLARSGSALVSLAYLASSSRVIAWTMRKKRSLSTRRSR